MRPRTRRPAVRDTRAQVARGRVSMLRLGAERHDVLVRLTQCEVQKTERIENRVRGVPEALEHRLERRLGSTRAFRVSTHAIDHEQECRVLAHRDRDAILIVFAMADETQLRVLDPQCTPRSARLRRGFIAPNQHDPQHDGLCPARAVGLLGHAHLGAAHRQSSLSRSELPAARRAARSGRLISARRLPRVVRRGKVDCTLNFRAAAETAGQIEINRALAERLLARARELGRPRGGSRSARSIRSTCCAGRASCRIKVGRHAAARRRAGGPRGRG